MIDEISPSAGPGGDRDQRRDVGAGVGDERLGAVDHPLAVVQHGAGLGRAGVRTRLRLGQPEAGERAAGDEVGQPALLLLVGAVGQDRVDAEPDTGLQRDADRLVDAAELLDRDAERGEVARRSRRTPRGRPARTGRARPSRARRRPASGGRGPTARRAARPRFSAKSRTTLRKVSWSSDSSNVISASSSIGCLTFTSTSSNASRVTTRDGRGAHLDRPRAGRRTRRHHPHAALLRGRGADQPAARRHQPGLQPARPGPAAADPARPAVRHDARASAARSSTCTTAPPRPSAASCELLLGPLDEIAADLRARQADLRRTLSEVADVAEQCRERLAQLH